MDFTLQDVLLGKLHTEIEILNYFIMLVKLHTWIRRKHIVTLNLSAFMEIIKMKFRTEKYNSNEKQCSQNLNFRLDGSNM